jgi:hypothetical protein
MVQILFGLLPGLTVNRVGSSVYSLSPEIEIPEPTADAAGATNDKFTVRESSAIDTVFRSARFMTTFGGFES